MDNFIDITKPDNIAIVKQEDGNWIGKTTKFGKLVTIRDVKPEDVLVRLITHSGE